jgi:signal transduction histidine kinase
VVKHHRDAHPDSPPVVVAADEGSADLDPALVAVALENLLTNAAKYAPSGGPHELSAKLTDDSVVFTVADHGPGVASRDLERIFEPFERGDDRLSTATEGSGIGLSLVRQVARAHGGDAHAESAPGHGARFVVRLRRFAPSSGLGKAS